MDLKQSILVLVALLYVSEAKLWTKDFVNKRKFSNVFGQQKDQIKIGDAGDPLILTDLINQGKIDEAQQAAEVQFDEFLGVKSYSGFLKVDETFNSNLFFWFFPSESNVETDPVILWLQGGPGSSSMFGLFQENGPFVLTGSNKLELRPTSWTTSNSVLYFDQPAGTGWSFTDDGYAQNQTKVSTDLYEALTQFFKLFPNLQSNEFFITGESYGGKYVPAISYAIHQNNPSADLKINLKGLAIGNGWSVPEVQMKYANYFYEHGFIDLNTKNSMNESETEAVELIQQGKYERAASMWNIDLAKFQIATGFSNMYNYLYEEDSGEGDRYLAEFFEREDVRKAIHVGNVPYDEDFNVYYYLTEDIPRSVAPLITELINNYRVLLYSGQLDLIVPYSLTVTYLQNLDFNSASEYRTAKRDIWYYNDGIRIAGFAKTAGNLTEVLVRNAGHMVPSDQPEWALDLITRFVKNKPFA